MKPKILKISAFGVFKDEVIIDFAHFKDYGLYLISGDTGAGKTTIFDAICYALYNSASGSDRHHLGFRSKYANKDTKTYVELLFTQDNQEFLIKRNPEHQLLVNGKIKTVKASVELFLANNEIINKTKDVENKIKEIIGFNFQQFKQISMLAQGEFLKLLHASTLERQKIFRDLFQTFIYEKLQLKLRQEEKDLALTYQQLILSIKENLAIINYEYYDDLVSILANIAQELNDIEKSLVDKQQLKSLKNEELIKIKIQLAKFQDLKNKEKALIQLENEQLKIETLLNEKLNKQLTLNVSFENLDKLNLKLLKLEQFLSLSKQKTLLLKEVEVLKNQTQNHQNLKKAIKEKIELLNNELIKINQELSLCENINQEFLILENKFNDVSLKLKQLQDLKKEYSIYFKDLKTLEIKQQDLLSLKEKSLYQELKFKEIDYLYKSSASAFLALNLKKDEPCLVCGSVNHPNPCKLKIKEISFDEYKKASTLSQKLNKQYQDLQLLTAKEINRLKIVKEYLLKQAQNLKLNDLEKIDVYYQEYSLKASDFEVKLNNFKEKLKDQEILIHKQMEKQDELTKLNQEIMNLELKILNDELNLKNYDQKLIEFKDVETEVIILKKMQSLTTEITNIKDDYYQNIQLVNELKIKTQTLNSEINLLKSVITELNYLKDSDLNNEFIKIENNLKDLEKTIYDLKYQQLNYQSVIQKLQKQAKEKTSLFEMYTMVSNLSLLVSGGVNDKMSLESYVLSYYFEEILNYSNVELMKLSQGQYEFMRSNQNKGNAKNGLDLDILDHYNGNIRSIKSLSGGESFKAALALAMGFAMSVQNRSGGLKVECLFIDEGFGSLDENSLMDAIKTLSDLSNNYLIGIISHVKELKDLIDKQIIIKKDRNIDIKIKIIY